MYTSLINHSEYDIMRVFVYLHVFICLYRLWQGENSNQSFCFPKLGITQFTKLSQTFDDEYFLCIYFSLANCTDNT